MFSTENNDNYVKWLTKLSLQKTSRQIHSNQKQVCMFLSYNFEGRIEVNLHNDI